MFFVQRLLPGIRVHTTSVVLAANIVSGVRWKHQYAPRRSKYKKSHKGRVSVPIGGSLRGTRLEWGDYGIRLKDRCVQYTARQLSIVEQLLKRLIKGNKGSRVYTRFVANIPVCVKGNETRMGKGKGSFSHWSARVPIGHVLFEIGGGKLRAEVARNAFRQAAYILPGRYEFITRDSPPRLGNLLLTEAHSKEKQEITDNTEE
ncbi:mitochondrial 54S ribosomal protein YmL47 [Schizosaccharomyces japonicus yFS275]|uniref:Ribosomal protein subunit L16 n=1 Tax=Schizosaccharomyces japonicus (strain yFS275 / FY16936) TaxID=402676 RepID=B6K7H7_SCHJY|nr:mitochondrial 54S ribosomal protein YmL47 [Schizosaccharomyces japonicus yFS275]EEB09481.1 ribosomal protein subunit L16 [Schizosaccharomyces japonicus yFS275]